jgi:acetyltransferase-like isoleucine patch superfamily enzyme
MDFEETRKKISWVLRLPSPLKEILTSIGLNNSPFQVEKKGDVVIEYLRSKCKVTVGRGTYGHVRVFCWDDSAEISLGSFTSIGSVTIMLGGSHHHSDVSTYPFKALYGFGEEESVKSKGNVVIGNDVWIGRDVFILENLVVGNGAVLGARSVVTRDIPGYAIAVGNPAEVKKYRFTEGEIRILQEIAWWELPDYIIKQNIDLFYTRDVSNFANSIKSKAERAIQSSD